MKTYEELTKEQKKAAVDKMVIELIQGTIEGHIIFECDGINQARNRACQRAEASQTPWFSAEIFFHEEIFSLDGEEIPVRKFITGLGTAIALQALYPEPRETIIDGIL